MTDEELKTLKKGDTIWQVHAWDVRKTTVSKVDGETICAPGTYFGATLLSPEQAFLTRAEAVAKAKARLTKERESLTARLAMLDRDEEQLMSGA